MAPRIDRQVQSKIHQAMNRDCHDPGKGAKLRCPPRAIVLVNLLERRSYKRNHEPGSDCESDRHCCSPEQFEIFTMQLPAGSLLRSRGEDSVIATQ